MTARVLIVDDIAANVRLLEARLRAEYFDVRMAFNGRQALEMALAERVDLILLDVMMPDMSGFEVCAALKADLRTAQIPVIMVTALDQAQDRIKGLESGADDFLTKPVSETALITRVKSLVRLKAATDELSLRSAAMFHAGLNAPDFLSDEGVPGGRILVVDDRENSSTRIRQGLAKQFHLEITADPERAIALATEQDFDLLIVSLSLDSGDGLRVGSAIRALDRMRYTPVLLVTDTDQTPHLIRALDSGVNDYIMRPVDPNELRARVRTQLRRKRYAERLRNMVSNAMELAITDPLTGLYNRRYLDAHLTSLISRATPGKPLCALLFDIDHFKSVNDTYGHDAGDDVLKDFAGRLRRGVRGIDLIARFGGEEFVLVMPETDAAFAGIIAERLRLDVEQDVFLTRGKAEIPVTVSIGIAEWRGPRDSPDALLKRADQALYAAKRAGRNRVVASAA